MTTGPQKTDVGLVDLNDDEALEPHRVGRKAATLARLRREGFSVPSGFVVTTEACRRLGTGSSNISTIGTALAGALDRLPGPVAVRSSAVAEDGGESSYAGQYHTLLDLAGVEKVIEAVGTCIRSAEAPHLAAYRSQRPEESQDLALLVQSMVHPRAAGVVFSAHPVTGDRDTVVVNAVRGLGDRLVDGTACPDTWEVRNGEIEAGAIVEQAITESDVRELASMARGIEDLFGGPQDIEWAIDDRGVWIL